VYGLLRTVDAASPLTTSQVSISLALFVLVYFALFGTGIAYMLKLVHKGPQAHEGGQPPEGGAGKSRTPARPLSAADDH
jgi:cytochrome d ubiquinol oxidase subunit I